MTRVEISNLRKCRPSKFHKLIRPLYLIIILCTIIDSTGNAKVVPSTGNFIISGNDQYVNSGWLVPKTQEKAYPGSSNTFA